MPVLCSHTWYTSAADLHSHLASLGALGKVGAVLDRHVHLP